MADIHQNVVDGQSVSYISRVVRNGNERVTYCRVVRNGVVIQKTVVRRSGSVILDDWTVIINRGTIINGIYTNSGANANRNPPQPLAWLLRRLWNFVRRVPYRVYEIWRPLCDVVSIKKATGFRYLLGVIHDPAALSLRQIWLVLCAFCVCSNYWGTERAIIFGLLHDIEGTVRRGGDWSGTAPYDVYWTRILERFDLSCVASPGGFCTEPMAWCTAQRYYMILVLRVAVWLGRQTADAGVEVIAPFLGTDMTRMLYMVCALLRARLFLHLMFWVCVVEMWWLMILGSFLDYLVGDAWERWRIRGLANRGG